METMQRFKHIDIGVIGEGEETLTELYRAMTSRSALSSVKGIIFRDGGRIIRTAVREPIKDLDSIPLPAWDLLPDLMKDYQQSVARVDRLPSISILTSRGCPCRCTFCARNVFGNSCRAYSTDRVILTLRRLKELYGIRSVSIEDENLVVFKPRLKEICRRMADERLDLTWSCTARIDLVDAETLQLMKEAGCWSISYGIESGSEKILKIINKGITRKQIIEALENTRKSGIESKGYFIIGLPGETFETIEETRQFVLSLPLDHFQMSFLNAFPGTEIYRNAKEYGTFDDEWENMNIWTPNFIPCGLTRMDLEREQKRIFRAFYFRPKVIARFLRRTVRSGNMAKYLSDGLKVLKFISKK